MDADAIIARRPDVVLVDELAHTNVPGSKNHKRFEDVLDILDAGISVVTAVNVQHIESLNDAIARITGVRVRETIPDYFLRRADEVVNIDVSVDTLRTRLRQGKIYSIEKIEQALANFFRKGNLSALRELALRQVAEDQAAKAHDYRQREGLEPAAIPEKVMVCMSSRGNAKKLLRTGSRIAGRLASDWYAVYVETPGEEPGRIRPEDRAALSDNIRFAKELGAEVIRLKARRVADALIDFARREGVTHVIFGQSARSRWDILLHGSVINRFLREARDATVQVVPIGDE
jgi:two-component system sensor histidine kinase KdpD